MEFGGGEQTHNALQSRPQRIKNEVEKNKSKKYTHRFLPGSGRRGVCIWEGRHLSVHQKIE